MIRAFSILLLTLTLVGCGDVERRLAGVNDSTMVDLFVDLHLSAARQRLGKALPGDQRDSVLARYHLTEARFRRIMNYYARNPDEYLAVYDSVLFRLERPPRL